jgi:putative CocE/NonD family hydrolase
MTTPQPAARVQVDVDVPVTLRDGTTLRANVYRPDGADPRPVLLTRLPYGKDLPLASAVLDPVQAARRGYIVVVQNVRGRFNSEGEWDPFIHEDADGYDTVEWAAALPGSNGRVGMYGLSYFGFTQWAAARERPPHLHALFPYVSWADAAEGVYMRGGALELGMQANWLLQTNVASVFRAYAGNSDPSLLADALARTINELDTLPRSGYVELPLREFGPLERVGRATPFVQSFERRHDREFLALAGVAGAYERIDLPVYHAGGWYDLFLGGTLRNFTALSARGAAPQKLLIGPWSHGAAGEQQGEQNYGFRANAALINGQLDLMSLQLLWFDRWLRDVPNGIESGPPVKIFVMGENVWRDELEWPLRRADPTAYYLHSGGSANSLAGDGVLSTEAPAGEPADRYVYDPTNPVPTIGGSLLLHPSFPAGPRDQRVIEARRDVLVYTTPPLERAVEVTGPIGVTLWASSSAVDTDFVARLVDVWPDGRAFNLTDGIIRARARLGPDEAESLIAPGRIYEFRIDLWATSNVFLAGHRIRLDITSSNFPRWDRNPNTGAPIGDGTALAPATQSIVHDAAHPSYLLLPLVPRA